MPENNVSDPGLERLKILIGLVKFLIGTVALGAVTLFFNHQYQNAQIALEEKKSEHAIALQDSQAEFDYLAKFMTRAMDQDLKVRIQLADYMKSVALSPKIKKIWSDYFDLLITEEKEAEADKLRLVEQENAAKEKAAKQFAEIPIGQTAALWDSAQEYAKMIQDLRNRLYIVQDKLDRQRYGTYAANQFDFENLLTQAQAAERAGHYEQQRDLLLQAKSRAPDSLRYVISTLLANVSRSLHDFPNALAYMEEAIAAGPRTPTPRALSGLAIMQKNDNQIGAALKSLYEAESLSNGAEKLYIELVIAGYLIHAGQHEEGLKRFASIKDQLDHSDDFAVNLAWFYAVADRKEEFYKALEHALEVDPTNTLVWIDQEVDIDKYRNEPRFQTVVAKYKGR
jgi:hypothetical protein